MTRDEVLKTFLDTMRPGLRAWSQSQQEIDRYLASKYNLLGCLRPDEPQLSDLIAELLRPDGSHGQAALFLREFLKAVGVDPRGPIEPATVSREASLRKGNEDKGPVDILVDFDHGRFVVAIENKPWGDEQEKQLERYVEGLSDTYGQNYVLLFLTTKRREPMTLSRESRIHLESEGRFKVIYFGREFRQWVEVCREKSEASRLRDTFATLSAYIDQHIEEAEAMAEDPEVNYIQNYALDNPENLKLALEVAHGAALATKTIIMHFVNSLNKLLAEKLGPGWQVENDFSTWPTKEKNNELVVRGCEWPAKYSVVLQLATVRRVVYMAFVKRDASVQWPDGKLAEEVKTHFDARCGRGRISSWGWWRQCDSPHSNWFEYEDFRRLKWESKEALAYYLNRVLRVKDAALDIFPSLKRLKSAGLR